MPRLERWARAAAGAVLFALSTRTTADPDLWGHLRFGLDTWQARMLTAVDPYSFTQDRPWINHEWLSELQMALTYRLGGVAGLCLLKGALVFGALWLVWNALRGADLIVAMLAGGLVVLATGSITSTLRPQLWSMAAMAVLCLLLQRGGGLKRWGLPLLFAIWANVHGGWVVGFGVLAAWAAADAWSDRRGALGWCATLAASAAATLMTPYGLSLWRFLLETVHTTRDITEWQPLFSVPTMNWLPVVAVAGAAVFLLRRPQPHRLQAAAALTMLAYGAWRVSRIGPLFVVAAAILLAPEIVIRWPARPADPRASVQPIGFAGPVSIAMAALAASAWIASSSLRCIEVAGPWAAPLGATSLLATAPPGRLVTFFDWGEYAIWHFGPRLRVSMDGRRETVYSDARLAEANAIVAGDANGLAALESWRAEYVWLPATSAVTRTWLASHGYRLALDDTQAFLAVRDDIPPWTAPPDVADGRRCFPQ